MTLRGRFKTRGGRIWSAGAEEQLVRGLAERILPLIEPLGRALPVSSSWWNTVIRSDASSKLRTALPLADLLGSASEGDFAELYDRTAPVVYRAVLRVVRDRAQAAEVTQEVYLQVWNAGAAYRPERGTVTTWLLTLAHHRAVDRVRHVQAARRRDHAPFTEPEFLEQDPVAAQVLAQLDLERLHRAMDRLTDVQREVILLAKLDGFTHTEIAQTLDLPLGTVKTRIRDGLQRLRLLMVAT